MRTALHNASLPTSAVEAADECALVNDGLIVAVPELSRLAGELVDVDGFADFKAVTPEQSFAAHHVGSLKRKLNVSLRSFEIKSSWKI